MEDGAGRGVKAGIFYETKIRTDMYEKIKELAECNRTARTDAERAAVKAEMEALQRDDPAAYADALECLIHETAKEVEELTVSEKLGVVTTPPA